MGVCSLILGIISLVMAILPLGLGWLAGILGILGIIMGAVARKNTPSGVATAGLVLSIIGTVLGLLFYLACVACVGGLAGAASSLT